MKHKLLALLLVAMPAMASGQNMALKTNLLHDASTTLNLGVEIRLGGRTSLDIPFSYNPWEFDQGKRFKFSMAQPELRVWFCESLNGAFLGVHAHGGEFNIAKAELPWEIYPQLGDANYQGSFYGGGLSLGYQWMIGRRWGLEFTLGGGYARVDYDKYTCGDNCGDKLESGSHDYWGLTRAGLSLSLMIF